MADIITQKTITKAFSDQNKGISRDITDGRVAGLELRVRPRSVRWSMRTALHGKRTRYDLGPAVEGSDDVGGLSVDGARSLANQVATMCRKGHNPATFLSALASGVSMETQLRVEAARPKVSWSWEKAKLEFLADVKRARRPDTHRDYKGKLQAAELDLFAGRFVNTITRNEMAAAIAAVHRRQKEVMAEGMVRVIRRMWNWLAEAARQDQTSVAEGVMTGLKAPDRTRKEKGEPTKVPQPATKLAPDDPAAWIGDAPPAIEIGRVLAVARLGCLPPRIGLGLELLIGTAQRRRTIVGINSENFHDQSDGEVLWSIPPYFRKSGTARGERCHAVPCVGFAATAAKRLEQLANADDTNWLFPAGTSSRTDVGHAESGLFNDWLAAIPGVTWSPHDVRYAFATYGERDLGFKPGEAGVILDHLEGTEPDNVTSQFYSSDPQMRRKREMSYAWTAWCVRWTKEAIKRDKSLRDAEPMYRAIRNERYKFKKKKAA
ncbi:integrase arm-type DNA-binding domain-containing protein [Bradyrhizobium sp. CCBAU 45384]|uniref:integrase arm-type DNA-binding domain-containing protein n=1 Tax=Bradyrhizobium sp. CCBAU 45384 TaxID=858428 RepID=UPI002304D375|nr:hypothetical protein [Bradyrhizobium sp. CCBAU 45384]MDA9411894.1 hypothetical protein [Bradyrhizobium sp. CCBAU 45384]